MSKREYDELGFLYEQKYGPYKPFKEWIIVDGDINLYIRQLIDIAFETEVDKINVDTVEKFLFNRISREESRIILSLLLKNNIISEQGKLLMSNEEYSEFTHKILEEVRQKVKSTEQEREVKESKELDSELLTFCMLLLVSSMFLCAMTYKVFGFAFLIPVFVTIGACLYKYTR
jgi:hypothetical protein